MTQVSENILIESLDLLEEGLTVPQILERFPEHGEALRPYLETAVAVSTVAHQPTLYQKQSSQKAFLEQTAALKNVPVKRKRPLWWRLLSPVAGLVLLLFVFAFVLVNASTTTLPGDALYDVKRLTENAQIELAGSNDDRLDLIAKFKNERIREIEQLLLTDRMVDVEFDGLIEEMNEDQWLISDIPIFLTEHTVIEGTAAVQSVVRVNGRIENKQLSAITILVLGSPPAPEPTPTPEPDPTQTPSAPPTTSTAVVTETATATPTTAITTTATETSTATATAVSPTPESTATAIPTQVPPPTSPPATSTPDDNNNDNDDNSNENEDSNDNNDNDDSSGSGNGNDNENDNDDDDSSGSDNGNDNENDNDDDDSSGSGNGNDNENDNDNDDDDDNSN